MKILVTGGGGFIGRSLIPVLSGAGHRVIAASRDADTAIAGATVRRVGELGPETDWSAALDGIEAVIHLAARVHVMDERAADPLAENRRVNGEGTRKLAADAARAGVGCFIFLSTIKVNGEATEGRTFRAADAPAPRDPYAIAKLEAEEALREIAEDGKMRVDIVRPPLVYGPGVRGNFLSLLNICARGTPLPLAAIDNRRSLIFVGNLADLIRRLVDDAQRPGGLYLCRDGQDVSTPELFRRVSRALGGEGRVFPVPGFFLRLAGVISGKSAAVSRLTDSLAVDDGPTREVLGWTPPFSMLQGLDETAAWFRRRHEG